MEMGKPSNTKAPALNQAIKCGSVLNKQKTISRIAYARFNQNLPIGEQLNGIPNDCYRETNDRKPEQEG